MCKRLHTTISEGVKRPEVPSCDTAAGAMEMLLPKKNKGNSLCLDGERESMFPHFVRAFNFLKFQLLRNSIVQEGTIDESIVLQNISVFQIFEGPRHDLIHN